MKRISRHIIVAISMAFVLFIASTPADFIHQFAHHKDTVHAVNSGTTVEKPHHHCQFLSFMLDAFTPHTPIPFRSIMPAAHFAVIKPLFSEGFVQRCIVATSLRGPPATC